MMTVYVYELDTMADWELGHVTAELHSGRFFKRDAQRVTLKAVSASGAPVRTMGGLTVVPDGAVDDIAVEKTGVLLLPGANTWKDPKHGAVLDKAEQLLAAGGMVCAICGATVALAERGLLDHRRHTSNGPGFLEMMAPGYRGQGFYADSPSVADHGLITAGSTGGLLWAKQIIACLDVFAPDTLEAWYDYFSTGAPQAFFALMDTLPSGMET